MNEQESVRASRARLILAIYLDFLLFSVPWALMEHFLIRVPAPAKYAAFALIELLLRQVIRRSPGVWLLSAGPGGKTHWLPTVAGVLLLLEGTKGLVRWTMWTPPVPLFGMQVSAEAWPWVAMTFGAIECVLAYLFFRMRPAALYAGVAYFVTVIISTVMSWPLWDAWAALNTTRRRAYQGMPLREGEIEQMQAMVPEVLLIGLGLYLAAVVIAGALILRRRKLTDDHD